MTTSTLTNPLKEKFAAGTPAIGVWVEMMNPELVEYCGFMGFDYAMIDGEHFPLDPRLCLELVRACEVSGMVPIVRVPSHDPSIILSYLETGCRGIYVPHVNSSSEALAIVDAVKYAPIGHRGAGSGRYLQYGMSPLPPGEAQDYLNRDTLIIALIEEVAGIEDLDAIVATPGIDVIGIGTGDLSHSMGFVGQKNHPDVLRTALDAEERVRASGKVFDSVVASSEDATEAIARGSLMVSIALRGVLRASLSEILNSVRSKA
jgi:4-hydroxy-2-oxoheptanedioate aldolase